MYHSNHSPAATYFCLLMATGILVVVIGAILIPNMPHFQLDAVLDHSELQNETTKANTLRILERATGNSSILTTALGTFIFVLSLLGYRSVTFAEHLRSSSISSESDLTI